MIDSFVFVAPIYLLGVIALVGFVGCAELASIDDWNPQGPPTPSGPPQALTNIQAMAGDGVVTLLWDPVPHALLYDIYRETSPPAVPPASYLHIATVNPALVPPNIDGFHEYEDHDVTNGVTYHYVITVTTEGGTSVNSPDIEATPMSPFGPFVTDFVPGTVRDGEDAWFGFSFVAVVPLTVHKLGRFYGPSNNAPHDMVLIEAASLQIVGKATVDLASEDLDGFKYAAVMPAPAQLNQNDEYFLLSLEALGGDDFLTQDTTVTTNAEAAVTNAVDSAMSLVVFTPAGGPDHTYGPVNFQY